MLKSPEELARMLDLGNCIIVDCRPYKEYEGGHVPGAVNVDFFQYHWIDTTKEGLKAFEKQMQTLFSFMGVTSKATVVFYEEVSGMGAARGVWLLRSFSHENAFMLNGGFGKWKSLGLPVETRTNGFKPSKFSGKIDAKMLVGFEHVRKRLGKAVLVDTRTKDEYEGRVARAARKGRIPGAVNIDWTLNINEDGTMKTVQELEKLYKFQKEDEIITYCQGGYRAANSFVALKLLGFKNIKVYLGSWGEWGNRLELPAEG
ncbi:MAG: sulfurtransferase [Thaumarchaeota archaeon]|nr:sulfurtransferase [Nitrososphaerota archaeon]